MTRKMTKEERAQQTNDVDAADRIEELEAEIERLRGAFKAEKEMKDG